MAEKIGFQSGIDASINALIALDPAHKAGYEKLRRTLKILAADHDAAISDPAPPPPPPPPPPSGLAPQSYNRGSRGQDARYNIRINCTGSGDRFVDGGGFQYDGSGLCLGGRSGQWVEGLKPSDMMDGKDPWDTYEWMGRTFPPYPAASYEV